MDTFKLGPHVRVAVLVLLTTSVYASSVPGGFLWDDDDHVYANAGVQSPAGLPDIWLSPGVSNNYFPLTTTAFWLQTRLWGNWPPGFRGVNLAVHVLNALLVWYLLERLAVPAAYLAAVVFAVHPVQVQTVAWITELKNLLGFFLYLLAVAAWWRFAPPEASAGDVGIVAAASSAERADGRRRWSWYGLAFVLFLAATLAKANMVVWVGGVALLRYLVSGRVRFRELVPLMPFLAAGACVAAFSVFFEQAINKSVGEAWSASLLERSLIAGWAAWFYAGKILWPATLSFFYPMWRPDPDDWTAYVPLLAAFAVPCVCWLLVRRVGRGPLVAVLWFGGTVLPALGFVNIYGHRYSQVYDYMQYPADLGLIVLVVGAGAFLADRMRLPDGVRVAIATAVVVALAFTAHARAAIYVDLETLWRDTVATNPAAWNAHNNLAALLLEKKMLDQAMFHASAACDIAPREPEPRFNRGCILEAAGRLDEAVADYRLTLTLDPRRRDYRHDLAVALALLGREGEALEEMATAMSRSADHVAPAIELAKELCASHAESRGIGLLRARAATLSDRDPLAWQLLYLLAWELATADDDAIRDGDEAITVAERGLAITGGRSPQLLESLAAGHAARGDFATARAVAARAAVMAKAAGLQAYAEEVQKRSAGYDAGLRWRRAGSPGE